MSWVATASLAVAGLALALWMRDRWRLRQLLRWTARDGLPAAPDVGGAHAELAYRLEKLLRRQQAAGRRERDRLQQLLSALEAYPNGILLLDAEDHIAWMNAVAAEHHGLEREHDLRQNVRNLLRHPAFIDLLQGDEGSATVGTPEQQLALTLKRFGDERQGRMALVLSQDVTERLRMERMRRDFVANVSHEIRSPLTVLSGFLETLQSLELAPEERQRSLALMRQQADRMQALVTDLLTLASLEGAAKPPPDEWVDLRALLERIVVDARAADGGRHQLSIDPLEAVRGVQLSGRETEWLSAFGNLVSNALRYTPAGGTVHVAWRHLDDGRSEFAVLDTGVGIAPEHLPRLTERFYRVDRSRSRDTGGTGLGLAIVKHIAQRHGAELVIASQVGQGSQFRIRIPAHRVRGGVSSPLPAAAPAGPAGAGGRW